MQNQQQSSADDHQAITGLRHDVSLVHLRAGSAKRPVEGVCRRLGDLDASGRPGAADVERRLIGVLCGLREAWLRR